MDYGRPASPVRAAFFYSILVFLLVQVGGMLGQFRLVGSVLTQVLILLGAPLFFAWYFDRRRMAELFRLRPLTLQGVVKSVLLGFLGWALAYVLGVVIFSLVTRAGGKLPQVYQQLTSAPFLIALVTGAIVPSICEEMAFRGYLQFQLGPLGQRASVVVTAVLFGAMHLSLVRVVPLIVLGYLFATAVQRTGSILSGMIMHFVNNAVALGLTFFYRPEGGAQVDAPVLSTGALLTAVLMLVGLTVIAIGLIRTFGPGDAVGRRVEPEATPAAVREGFGQVLLPLLPAVLIYAWAAGSEVVRVFAGR